MRGLQRCHLRLVRSLRSAMLFGKSLLLGLQCCYLLCAAGLEFCCGVLRCRQLRPECSAVVLGGGCHCFCVRSMRF